MPRTVVEQRLQNASTNKVIQISRLPWVFSDRFSAIRSAADTAGGFHAEEAIRTSDSEEIRKDRQNTLQQTVSYAPVDHFKQFLSLEISRSDFRFAEGRRQVIKN